MSRLQNQAREHTAARLAPEIVLHILSFLDHRDQPARLLPILTLCKSWARLALELIYEQPVLTLYDLESFITTLQLQDRLQNGQLPFWDANCSTADAYVGDTRISLGIDYRAMIKKPCRIVGCVAYPTKEDLTQLWDLQTLLWTVPTFSKERFSSKTALEQDTRSSPQPSPPSSGNSSCPESSHVSAPPSPTSPTHSSTSSMDSPFPATPRSYSPLQTPSKIVLVRRKKAAPPSGPVVMLLELSMAFTDTMLYILRKVPGMALRKIHYRSLLDASLMEIVENQLPYLNEIVLSRPPGRPDDFTAFAQLLGNSKRLAVLRFDQCTGVGATLLSIFAQACGDSLETLQIHQPATFRHHGLHAFFPVDSPEAWVDTFPSSMAKVELESTRRSYPSMAPGQTCSKCGFLELSAENPTSGGENEMESLGISEGEGGFAPVENGPAPLPAHSNTLAQSEPESIMDLAMLAFADNCPRLAHLVLNRLTWLSDSGLAGFGPPATRSPQPEAMQSVTDKKHQGRRHGLSSISILDSYYGSALTIEGVLDLCGADLDTLVLDRKSCWKRRRSDGLQQYCLSCQHKEWLEQERLSCMSSGDRLIWGLLEKPPPESVRHLQKLVLVEHWVSVAYLRAAMERWVMTLRVLSLRLFKCSDEELTNALIPISVSGHGSALERLLLKLPWMDAHDPALEKLAKRLFAAHGRLESVEINNRQWGKDNREPVNDILSCE